MSSLQDAWFAFGTFVRSPVSFFVCLQFVRWGSMTLDGHGGCLSCLRYSMGACRGAPPHMLLAGSFSVCFNDPLNPILCFFKCFNDSKSSIFCFFGAFNDTHSRKPKKLRKVTFELRLSYEKLRKVTKSYVWVTKKLLRVTKSYEKLQTSYRITFCKYLVTFYFSFTCCL